MDAEVVIIVEPTIPENVEQIVAILLNMVNFSSDMLVYQYHVPRASNNLLVVFEETGGNPFEISVKLRSAKAICAQVSESHYPPLRKWSQADLNGWNISRNDMTPEMHLKCQDGHIMSSVEFASYGTPKGSCQKFSRGNCHASSSSSVVTEVLKFLIL
uniref:SUEL-type lectin domain-containing protein n=1 Tax=Salix viminalis TaxID=40686 RepID=A0A6N2MPM9_SALVM